MQNNVNKYVRASEISLYYMCPRLVYFRRRRDHGMADAEVRAGFFKALSPALASVVGSRSPEAELENAIRKSCEDCLLVYGTAHEPDIIAAGNEARTHAKNMLSGLLEEQARLGEEGLVAALSPASTGVLAYSDKLRMSGHIDKLLFEGRTPIPIIVSASGPPASGIYASDRVRLAAYAMLLSEKYGVDCRAGAIEYVTGWCLRRAEIRYEDRRKALYARNRILDMDMGRMPEYKKGTYCGRCEHHDACNVRVSPLSRLFKKS